MIGLALTVHKIEVLLHMLILLDGRPLQNAGPDAERSLLIVHIAAALAGRRDLRWLLVMDHSFDPGIFPEIRGMDIITQRALPGKLGWRLWYDRLIPRLAKKYRADVVMTTGGVAADTSLPQCLWMPERTDALKGENFLPLYTTRLEESLRRAGTFFCYSVADRDWLAAKDIKAAEKGVVIHPSPLTSIKPLSTIDREQVKAEFALGREYFLADAKGAGEEDLVEVLKAFSLFKKRQHSNLQLVVKGLWTEGLQTKLDTYKYKDEVHGVPVSADKDGRLTAGAYAGLFLFDKTSLGTPVLNAWKAGTPVIGDAGNPLLEGVADAVLAANPSDPASLSAQLMSVYKDEALRSRLIERGLVRLAEWEEELTISAVWSAIDRNCPIIS